MVQTNAPQVICGNTLAAFIFGDGPDSILTVFLRYKIHPAVSKMNTKKPSRPIQNSVQSCSGCADVSKLGVCVISCSLHEFSIIIIVWKIIFEILFYLSDRNMTCRTAGITTQAISNHKEAVLIPLFTRDNASIMGVLITLMTTSWNLPSEYADIWLNAHLTSKN